MVDCVRVPMSATPDTHPGHHDRCLTWINRDLAYPLQPPTDADHPRAHTHLMDIHRRSLSVQETVEEILPQRRRSLCTHGKSRYAASCWWDGC
jgi:hypothetical protein